MFDFQLNKVSIKANISFLAKYLEKVYFQSTERKDYTIKKQYKSFYYSYYFYSLLLQTDNISNDIRKFLCLFSCQRGGPIVPLKLPNILLYFV
jgi:hypothetical protein